MVKTLEVPVPAAAADAEQDIGLRGEDGGPAPEKWAVIYGKNDCPYGWVCVAEQHGHDLSPLALIDVYGLPEDDER
jgi:hypothetical protein